MATATKSAAEAVTKLFGTVTVSADAVTTLVNGVGNAFSVLDVKSSDWLKETRKRSAGLNEDMEISIIDEVTASIAARVVKREESFAGNPKLKAAYDAALERVTAAVQAA
jgi:hypothetical protein